MKHILEHIKKYVPVSWPLQSFIAVNPLFDLTEMPFDHALSKVAKYASINGTLSLNEYYSNFKSGKISLSNLDFAIKEFLYDKNLDQNNRSRLVSCLINQEFQNKLVELLANKVKTPAITLIADLGKLHDKYDEKTDVKEQVISFCNDFFDLGQAKWSMPVNAKNLFKAWLEYAQIESHRFKKILIGVSEDSLLAIEYFLTNLEIPEKDWQDYLGTIAFKILGWASVIKWLESRPDNPYFDKTAVFSDLLAIWLGYEMLLKNKYKLEYKEQSEAKQFALETLLSQYQLPQDLIDQLNYYNLALIWQRAAEHSYQDQLIGLINSVTSITQRPNQDLRAKGQLIFCIDTRSEGLRRHLEHFGNYQTYGFAGFFGVGFKLHNHDNGNCSLQCPAIVIPDKELTAKEPKTGVLGKLQDTLGNVVSRSKLGFFSPFILFDALGGWFSASLIGKTLLPEYFTRWINPKKSTKASHIELDIFDTNGGFSKDELAEKIAFVLKAIGLVDNFAKFVIIAGHQAESENNPYQSSLDCGACGGNGGVPNAIAFCQAANDIGVRKVLANKYGITLPNDTFFVSACHFTTTDELEYYNLNQLALESKDEFSQVSKDINQACAQLRNERITDLYGENNLKIRKTNWAELIPEMALANNAAFIIGPRHITANLNLQRRSFLHSYDPALDPEGEILSFIFNAPVVVGHWINSQYYFSSTDPELYSSGNKAIHNVVGGFGVMEGNFSDYKIGLPTQSLSCLDVKAHEPLRLLVVVYAKREVVDKIMQASPAVANIFNGRWAHLEIIEPV